MQRLSLTLLALTAAAGCNTTVNGRVVDAITGKPIVGIPAGETSCSTLTKPPGPDDKKLAVTDDGICMDAVRIVAKSVRKAEPENAEDGPIPSGDPNEWVENNEAGLTCLQFSEDIQTDGSFTMSLCLDKTSYTLETTDSYLFMGETDVLEQGYAGGQTDIKVWRAPKGSGVWELTGEEMTNLRRVSGNLRMVAEFVPDTNEEDALVYTTTWSQCAADTAPEDCEGSSIGAVIEPNEYLVITGASAIEELKLWPLISDFNPRDLGPDKDRMIKGIVAMYWLGVKWNDDEKIDFERIAPTEVKSLPGEVVAKRGHAVKYIKGSDLPEGRWALGRDKKDRFVVLDFGKKQPKPEKPSEEEEGS